MCAHVKAWSLLCSASWGILFVSTMGWCGWRQKQTGLSFFGCLTHTHTKIHSASMQPFWHYNPKILRSKPQSPSDHQGSPEAGRHLSEVASNSRDLSRPRSACVCGRPAHACHKSHYFNTGLMLSTFNTSSGQHKENHRKPRLHLHYFHTKGGECQVC